MKCSEYFTNKVTVRIDHNENFTNGGAKNSCYFCKNPCLCFRDQQLQDAPTILELPTDYPRPPIPSFRGDGTQPEACQIETLSTLGSNHFCPKMAPKMAASPIGRYWPTAETGRGTAAGGPKQAQNARIQSLKTSVLSLFSLKLCLTYWAKSSSPLKWVPK